MAEFARDIKHALHLFRKSPGFTLAAVSALALGIGANTAVFTVVNAVLLKPLGFSDAGRLVLFDIMRPEGRYPNASIPNFASTGNRPVSSAMWPRSTTADPASTLPANTPSRCRECT